MTKLTREQFAQIMSAKVTVPINLIGLNLAEMKSLVPSAKTVAFTVEAVNKARAEIGSAAEPYILYSGGNVTSGLTDAIMRLLEDCAKLPTNRPRLIVGGGAFAKPLLMNRCINLEVE